MHVENERRLTRLEMGMLFLIASETLKWLAPVLGPAFASALHP